MPPVTRDAAIDAARQALGVSPATVATAWRVRRLDRPDAAYYLVVLGDGRAAEAVAAIDERSGALRGSARLQGSGSPIVVDAARARALAGSALQSSAELVWCPSQASRSALYPFWEVHTDAGIVYVDQQGRVFRTLEPAGPGGSTTAPGG